MDQVSYILEGIIKIQLDLMMGLLKLFGHVFIWILGLFA